MTEVAKKVQDIFFELVGQRAEVLRADRFPSGICSILCEALCDGDSSEATVLHFDELALNLVDWNSDAAFLVALHLFPERFSGEEIHEGALGLLLHVPNHLREAERLYGLEPT